jgi:hypothetical protein
LQCSLLCMCLFSPQIIFTMEHSLLFTISSNKTKSKNSTWFLLFQRKLLLKDQSCCLSGNRFHASSGATGTWCITKLDPLPWGKKLDLHLIDSFDDDPANLVPRTLCHDVIHRTAMDHSRCRHHNKRPLQHKFVFNSFKTNGRENGELGKVRDKGMWLDFKRC